MDQPFGWTVGGLVRRAGHIQHAMRPGEQWRALTQLASTGWRRIALDGTFQPIKEEASRNPAAGNVGNVTQPDQEEVSRNPAIGDVGRATQPEHDEASGDDMIGGRRKGRPGKKKRRVMAKREAGQVAERNLKATLSHNCSCHELWIRDSGPRAMLYLGDSTYAVGTQALLADGYAVAVTWTDGLPVHGQRPMSSVAPASGRVNPIVGQRYDSIGIRPRPVCLWYRVRMTSSADVFGLFVYVCHSWPGEHRPLRFSGEQDRRCSVSRIVSIRCLKVRHNASGAI